MSKSALRICALILIFGAIVAISSAQEMQWLQYRTSRHASDILGLGGGVYRNTSTQKPQDVELPQFKSDEPAFYNWKSPVAGDGGLWIVLDCQAEKTGLRKYDSIWIDSDCDGSLKDEKPVKAWSVDQNYAYIGPVRIVFEGEDGPVTYHLNLQIYESGERVYLNITSGCWYEGTIDVGGTPKKCILIDQNVNAVFNDKSPQSHNRDQVRIGTETVQETLYVGRYVKIDGKLYCQEVASDGAYITLTPAKDVKYGTINVPKEITGLTIGGENGLFMPKPENGVVRLPVGEYLVEEWRVERKDKRGTTWNLTGRMSRNNKVNVQADKPASLDVGEPVLADLTAQARPSDWLFNQEMKGRLGEYISITRNGSRASAPQVHIRNKAGTYDKTFALEYG